MNTIVIPVSKDRPEDDILELVNIIKTTFPDNIIQVSNALVIEMDVQQAVFLFKAIASQEIKPVSRNRQMHEAQMDTIAEYKARLIGSQYNGKKIIHVDCESEREICDLWLEDHRRVSFTSIQRAVEFVVIDDIINTA